MDYYYTATSANNSPANGLSSLIASLLNTLSVSGSTSALIKGGGSAITSGLNNSTDVINFFNPENSSSTSGQPPKAYLHVLLFDEMFKFDQANSYVKQVGDNYSPGTKSTIDKFFGNAVEVKKNGYAYVYISNESDELVYFDNLLLTHERGPILEETHYYPFGLTMAGISSRAVGGLENKKKYNGIEQNTDFDLNIYDAFYRNLDPQIGRFWQKDPKIENMDMWSPYTVNFDNPIKFQDPKGDEPEVLQGPGPKTIITLTDLLYDIYRLVTTGKRLETSNVKVDDILGMFAPISVNREGAMNAIQRVVKIEGIDKEINSLDKSNKSLGKRITEHEKKLEDYKKDPDGNDNKEFLKNTTPEIRKSIIEKRINHLNNEIKAFKDNIQKNNRKIEELKKVKEEISKLK